MKKIAILPSLLTLGNAFCGFLAIAYASDAILYSTSTPAPDPAIFQNKIVYAAWLIFGAMIFDALDGKVARMANLTSDFGGQLDSLCDAISFGVAPAILAKVVLDHEAIIQGVVPHRKLLFIAATFFALCAILRLARFNVENEHGDDAHTHFKGLPTPAAAGVIAVAVLFSQSFSDSWIAAQILKLFPNFNLALVPDAIRFLLPFMLPILGLLMVSRITYVHFTNYALQERKSFPFLIQVILLLIVAAIELELALAITFVFYAISGPVLWLKDLAFGRASEEKEEVEEEAGTS